MADESPDEIPDWKKNLSNLLNNLSNILKPIPSATFLILIATISLIGKNWNGLLDHLEENSYARGLITYLFAVVIIGVVIIIILFIFTADFTQESKERFSHAKDVLSLLLGIFGTIIGYYFG